MIVVVQRFDHAGLHQVQTVFVPDEDLRGRNTVPLQSLFATCMLKTIDDYIFIKMEYAQCISSLLVSVQKQGVFEP